MNTKNFPQSRELVLERIIDAPREKLWRCWTDPSLLERWFCPKPWKITDAALDVRPGGENQFVMHGPDGEIMPNKGVYLEVIPNERLVITDAYTSAWKPSEKPFMTAIMTFEDVGGGKTKYRAVARHWSEEDCKSHEEMGFHEGWGICADQLEQLAKSL